MRVKSINPIYGKICRFLKFQKLGELYVNGVILVNNKILFVNDNEELFCVDFSGYIM